MHGCFPSLFSIAFPPGLCVLDATELTSKTWVAEAERLPKRRGKRLCHELLEQPYLCYLSRSHITHIPSFRKTPIVLLYCIGTSGKWDQTRKLAIYFEWIEIVEIKRTWFRCNIWEASQSFSCQPRTKGDVAQWGDGSNGSWSFGISDLHHVGWFMIEHPVTFHVVGKP